MNNIAKAEPVFHSSVINDPKALLTLIDAIPAMVAYVDCNMKLQYYNGPFKRWFSLVDSMEGQSLLLVVGQEMFDQLQRQVGKVLVGGLAHFQISVSTPQGIQYFDATLSPDFDQQKKVKGFIFHSSDITERNRTERALKDYFENASIGLHWVNAEGIIIWANPAEFQMLGYSEAEYIGQHISKFHAKKPVIDDILHRLTSRQKLQNYDADLVCKDGSIRHVTINSTVLWEGEKFIHTRCFTIDVTDRKRAVKAVMESEERFRMMAALVPLIIWTTDDQGSCNFLSEKWEGITGKSVRDGLGKLWLGFIHPEDRVNIEQSWMHCLSAEKVFEAKFRFLCSTGEYQMTYANLTPRYDSSGKFVGHIGIIQDISSEEKIRSSLERMVLDRTDDLRRKNRDLRLAEKALQRKNSELEEINNQLESFAHIASHDLQEPLRKIQTFSSRLFALEGNKFTDKGNDLYQNIVATAARMRTLVQDLLMYSKSGEDGSWEKVDLNLLLEEVMTELEVQIDGKDAHIENLGLPSVTVIRFQFHQLFLNLVSNAVKFSRNGCKPQITIQSEIIDAATLFPEKFQGLCHCISVADNGIGFDPKFSTKIFEMFRRLHNYIEYEGTGIGLAICKRIVDNHKGLMVAEGELNRGATFKIYIPVQ